MKLSELEKKYNFHDCSLVTPIEKEGNDLTLKFLLASFWHSDEILEKYKKELADESLSFFLVVKFSQCADIETILETFSPKQVSNTSQKKETRLQEPIAWEEFPWNFECEEIMHYTADGKRVHAFFKGISSHCAYLHFTPGDIEISFEGFITKEEEESLYHPFEEWENAHTPFKYK